MQKPNPWHEGEGAAVDEVAVETGAAADEEARAWVQEKVDAAKSYLADLQQKDSDRW